MFGCIKKVYEIIPGMMGVLKSSVSLLRVRKCQRKRMDRPFPGNQPVQSETDNYSVELTNWLV